MFTATREQLQTQLDEIRSAGLYKNERVLSTAAERPRAGRGRAGGAQPLRQQLPRAGRPPRARRGGQRGARPLGLRPGLGALHLRHAGDPQAAGAGHQRSSSARRTPSSTAPASMPTAASSRRCWARRTRSSPTSSTTPASSTASACARRSASAIATATWPIWSSSCRRRAGARRKLIATDGVFSMDGYVAPLKAICDLADRYDAMVMVDDSHAVGFVGPTGRGTPELHGVQDRVDIITGTLGKALGGASGGYTSGRREIIELLRQRSRPYLFSNSLAPAIVAASLKVVGPADDVGRPARTATRQHEALPRAHDGAGLRHSPRRPPHRPGDARRRAPRRAARGSAAAKGRLRDGVLVSGRAAGQGAHSHADVGGAERGRSDYGERGIRRRARRARVEGWRVNSRLNGRRPPSPPSRAAMAIDAL